MAKESIKSNQSSSNEQQSVASDQTTDAAQEQGSTFSSALPKAFADGRLNAAQRRALVQNMGQRYGNRQVQRMIGSLKTTPTPAAQSKSNEIESSERISPAPFINSETPKLEAEADTVAQNPHTTTQSTFTPTSPTLQFNFLSDVGSAIGRGASWVGNQVRQGASWVGNQVNRGAAWIASNVIGPIRNLASSGWSAIQSLGSRISTAFQRANPTATDIVMPTYLLYRMLRNERRQAFSRAIAQEQRERAAATAGAARPMSGGGPVAATNSPSTLEQVDKVATNLENAVDGVAEINREILEGAVLGDFKENPTIWNTIGQIAIGFVPYAGQVADIRDLIATIRKLHASGYKDIGEWFNLVLVGIGFIPGVGDIIKAGGRGLKKFIPKAFRFLTKNGNRLWKGALKHAGGLLRSARHFGGKFLGKIGQLGGVLAKGAKNLGRRAIQAAGRAFGRIRGVVKGVSSTVSKIASGIAERARSLIGRAQGIIGRIGAAISGAVHSVFNSVKNLASRGADLVGRLRQRGAEILGNIMRRAADLKKKASDLLGNFVRQALEKARNKLAAARRWASEIYTKAVATGKRLVSQALEKSRQFIRNKMKWVKTQIIDKAKGLVRQVKERMLNFLKRKWERLKVILRKVPQGLTQEQFDKLSKVARQKAGHLSSDIRAHGSRVAGTEKVGRDLDIAIRVTPERFMEIINDKALSKLSKPNPGSNLMKTRVNSIENGIIQAGEARLSGLRGELEAIAGTDIDISIIRIGGPFDRGPWLPLK